MTAPYLSAKITLIYRTTTERKFSVFLIVRNTSSQPLIALSYFNADNTGFVLTSIWLVLKQIDLKSTLNKAKKKMCQITSR